ncbi:uncharacterized protein LOC101459310 [Ceratitis capitata]|uniref:uncharacterized protein LOC101459310 n=1 Tax=Ceratitis capitata TaxID=7213 RepID=UPI0006189457|nr:uncharacterized protein LOC101459310 [Ceratitis capitata]
MQLVGRTIFIAVCILSAYAIPNYIDVKASENENNGVLGLLVAQMRSALIDTRALTPAETTCATNYNNRTQQINNLLTTQTNACFENANRTLMSNKKSANKTITSIRKSLNKLQQQLANCSSVTEAEKFINCTTNLFDESLHLLDTVNSKAYQVEAQIAANQSQVFVVRSACVSAVISGGKANLTQTANDYQLCLGNISDSYLHDKSIELLD